MTCESNRGRLFEGHQFPGDIFVMRSFTAREVIRCVWRLAVKEKKNCDIGLLNRSRHMLLEVCMYVCVCVRSSARVHACMCVCPWVVYFLLFLFTFPLRQDLSVNLELAVSTRLADPERPWDPGSPCLSPVPALGSQASTAV